MTLSPVYPVKSSSTTSSVLAAWPKPLAKYENDLLTADNMAELLDTSSRTIYRLVEKGELTHVKVERWLYFPKRQVFEALQLGEAMQMVARKETPTVLVFWRGQRTADALSAVTKGLRAKHTIRIDRMVCKRYKPTGGDAA